MRKVVFTPAARAEFIEALDWYAEHAPPIVQRLRAEARALQRRLAAAPRHFPTGPSGTQRARLPHFPYIIVFRATGDAIQVIAFFHTSRDPRQWHTRI